MAHPGIGIVIAGDGTVYYTDLSQVWQIAPDGGLSVAVPGVHTHELYLDEEGNLYGEHEWYLGEATDQWKNYVWCLNKDGEFQKIIPEGEELLANTTLVRDNEGNSFWVKRSAAGNHLYREAVNGQNKLYTHHKFQNIRWMHYSKADHHVYVVDQLAIKRVTSRGTVEVITDNLKAQGQPFQGVADHHYVFGLSSNDQKEVYVAVFGAQQVKKVSADGVIDTVYTSPSEWSPSGVTAGTDGSIWVLEFSKNNTARVVKIGNDGHKTIYQP